MRKSDAAMLGGQFGSLNALVVATGVAIACGGGPVPAIFIGVLVLLVGVLPGTIAGVGIGAVAAAMALQPRWMRCAIIVGSAVAVFLGLTHLFDVTPAFALGIIPTALFGLELERRTRWVAPIAEARVIASRSR